MTWLKLLIFLLSQFLENLNLFTVIYLFYAGTKWDKGGT